MYNYTAGLHNKNKDKETFVISMFYEIVSLCTFGQSYSLVQGVRRDREQTADVHSNSVHGHSSQTEGTLDPLDQCFSISAPLRYVDFKSQNSPGSLLAEEFWESTFIHFKLAEMEKLH